MGLTTSLYSNDKGRCLALVVIMSSPIPSPMNIEGSIWGADLTDNETQYTFEWNEEQKKAN